MNVGVYLLKNSISYWHWKKKQANYICHLWKQSFMWCMIIYKYERLYVKFCCGWCHITIRCLGSQSVYDQILSWNSLLFSVSINITNYTLCNKQSFIYMYMMLWFYCSCSSSVFLVMTISRHQLRISRY